MAESSDHERSSDYERNEADIAKELRELKEWKENIGLKAVLSAEQYKKELGGIESQSEQFKNELIQTQTESRQFQRQIETLAHEKEDLSQQLKLLKEDINIENNKQNESNQLSQEALLIKDEQIEKLTFQIEKYEMEQQTLETQLSSKNEQFNAQQMEMNEFNEEISKLKIDKNDILLQLNEYKQSDTDIKMDKQMLSQQLQSQRTDFTNIKTENEKLNKQLKELKSTLDTIQKHNELLITDNDKYKELLSTLRETENNLRQKHNEKDTQLNELDNKFIQLNQQYQQQCNATANAQMKADQYNNQIEEMKELQVSEVASPCGYSHERQKTIRGLLPKKTVNRLNISKQSTLTIPTASNHFRSSTQKILSSTMSSVLDIRVPSGQTLFAALQDDGDDEYYYGGSIGLGDTRSNSIRTDGSFEFDSKKEVNEIENINTKLPGVGKRPSVDRGDIDLDSPIGMKFRKSVDYTEEDTKDEKFDMKLFQMKLQEEIKKEMVELEKELQREYNVEFKKKKDELIGAHEESLLFMTNEHEKLSKALDELKSKYDVRLKEMEPVDLSMLEKILCQILTI